MAYKAFVVGVNTLGLEYCTRDAQRLGDSLEKYGYEYMVPGMDKPRLQAAFESMIDNATQTDTLLLYFSGHGLPEKGKLWFFLSDDASKLVNKLNVNEWLDSFSDCRASNKLVILDCCHAGQGIAELRLELSERYLVLAASARLEKSMELETLQASFFTHRLCCVLDSPPQQVLESGHILSVQGLHKWLSEEAQKHNGQNAIQVPIPTLFGSHANFALAIVPSDEASSVLKATDEARRLQAVERRYRQLLLDTCDIVSLANLPEQDRHLVTRPLELRRLYVPLRVWVDFKAGEATKEMEWEEIDKRRAISMGAHLSTEAPRRERQRASVGKRLAEARRLVVLGDPGSGKTTLTRWIATAYLLRLKGDANWQDLPDIQTLPDADWLPIIVRCRDLDPTCLTGTLDDILSYTLRKAEMDISDAAILQGMLRQQLQAGTALLMLDGLDEIADPILRARFCQQLERIHLAYPEAPIIATSRIVGYREMGYRLGYGFEHVTLADLEPEEKDDFARRWCDLVELPERRAEAARELIHDIHSTDRIERMIGNPMLLTTMALVKRKVGKLPHRRAELYGEAVQVLLNWRSDWDTPLDLQEAIPQLEYVAYAMCDQGVQRMRREEILHLITQMRVDYPNVHQARNHTPEEFLSRLESRTGLVVEAGRTRYLGLEETVYEFRHLTFQEYMAARALVDGRFPGRAAGQPLADHVAPLAGRTVETSFTQEGEKEIAVVENWREALRLCVAICRDDDVDSILRAIATPLPSEPASSSRARAILATLCIADEPNVSEELAREVFENFASHVQERDRNFAIRTGVHIAAVAVAETRWAMLLCQCLVREFLQQDPSVRDYVGDIACIVGGRSAPSAPRALSTWLANQLKILQEGVEFEAIQISLGIVGIIIGKERVQIPPEIIVSLLTRLTGSAPMAHAAAEALAHISDNLWTPDINDTEQFVNFLRVSTNDPEAVRFLAIILGREKVEIAIDPLITWSNHPSRDLRTAIAQALGDLKSERALEPLLALLEDTATTVRSAAARALGNIGSERALEPLLARLEDPDTAVRSAAARALGNLKSERALEPLLARLEDTDMFVRSAAAQALGNLKSECALEPLLARLEGTATAVRSAAAQALGNLKSERALEPLLARLEDPDTAVRSAAARALGNLKSERALEPLLARLEDTEMFVRYAAAQALGNIGSERALEPLLALLEDTATTVRSAAARALGNIGSERALEPLLARLEDTDMFVRSAAAQALGNIGSERALEPLLALLEDTATTVRSAAAQALGNIGSERALEPLLALLEDTDKAVRQAVVEALSSRLDYIDRRLLSHDFDGHRPFLNPRRTISAAWVNKAAHVLNLSPEAVRARYEAFGPQFKLRLSWK